LFILAAVGKLGSLDRFENGLHAHELLPPAIVPALAGLLPIVELLVGAGLVLSFSGGVRAPYASLFAVGLLSTLTAYLVAVVVVRGALANCNCGWKFAASAAEAIGRNTLLIAAAGLPLGHRLLERRRNPTPDGQA
jgi:hypothetical protein